MSVENKYFVRYDFSREQIEKNLESAFRDLDIANKVEKECEEFDSVQLGILDARDFQEMLQKSCL